MPAVIDLSSARSPKKTPGKPKPPPGPKPALIIGVSTAVVLSLLFLVWFFGLRSDSDSHQAAPYSPSSRNLNGAGPVSGTTTTGSRVAPGLPGDGG
jgi:hypothetical protein